MQTVKAIFYKAVSIYIKSINLYHLSVSAALAHPCTANLLLQIITNINRNLI